MSAENIRERKKKRRFTLIFVPDAESEQPRTFSASKFGFIASLGALFFGIVAIIVIVVMFTPVRRLLPVYNPEIEQRYGTQILAIQEQVSNLLHEMMVLRSYNLRLRKALGENIGSEDSSMIAGSSASTTSASINGNETQSEKISAQQFQNAPSSVAEFSQPLTPKFNATTEQQEVGEKAVLRNFPLTVPVDGYVSRGFDKEKYHYGIDMVSKISSPVLASADGNVVFSGWTYDDGMMIMIAHSLGYVTVYKHNEALMKNIGASVKRGEVIALLGNTGNTSSGPHLHYEVWKNGIPYDPANYLLTTQ